MIAADFFFSVQIIILKFQIILTRTVAICYNLYNSVKIRFEPSFCMKKAADLMNGRFQNREEFKF